MKRILLPFLLTFIIAGELEVDGNLKVSGNIDAQNKAIKNVGVPTELTDAVNGNVLQNALRDDGMYNYKYYRLLFKTDNILNTTIYYLEMDTGTDVSPSSNWSQKLSELVATGWNLYQQTKVNDGSFYINQSIGTVSTLFITLRKSIEE